MDPDACVRLGAEKPIGAAFAALGCNSILDFLSSPRLRNGEELKRVVLTDDLYSYRPSVEGHLYFSATGVRNREDAAGSFARFLQALPLLPCKELEVSFLEFLSLDELSALCGAIASPLCTLRKLSLRDFAPRQKSGLANVGSQTDLPLKDALCNNTSLTSLSLTLSDAWCLEDCIIPALSCRPCSIKEVVLGLDDRSCGHTMEDLSGIFRGLAQNTISLTSLSLQGSISISQEMQLLVGKMIHTNSSLESLHFVGWQTLPGELVRLLFTSLQENVHLTQLSLFACGGHDWPSASFVLDSLRVNGILNLLDVRRSPLEGDNEAAVEAQLQRNKERVEQVKALKDAGRDRVKPTAVRLFICGLPQSGKTTLSESLVEWNSATSSWTTCLSCIRKSVPDQTQGIEISAIKNGKIKVSLWDMAGQEEYYAFHDYMFPNLSNDESPSLFLFVWNPIQSSEGVGKKVIRKVLEDFEQELKYWLRFIASKTLLSREFKPKVLVTITRADLVLDTNINLWIEESFKKCQEDFQEHIELDMKGVFVLDARDPSKVEDLALYVFECAQLLLDLKPSVYEACNLAREMIPKKALAPLVTKQEFYSLCKMHLGLDSEDMCEAVALSLNESGDLIYFKSFDLVVVDIHWFCHDLMGNLLHYGKDRSECNGFFSLKDLEQSLESEENSTKKFGKQQMTVLRTFFAKASVKHRICWTASTKEAKSHRIKGEDLVKLLIGLRLACRRDDGEANSAIFIPASLCTSPRSPVDPSKYLKSDDDNIQTFIGRRLKCKDSKCTFLTPGIFSELQVAFHNIYSEELYITLKEDIIAFCQGGVNVMVEFCKHEGQEHFIDVLIHSGLDLDSTIRWVNEKILYRIKNTFAQPRGIQGVQLVFEVIRPRSVKDLVSMQERRDAAVSVDKLRKILSSFLERNGLRDWDHLRSSALHSWHATKDSDCLPDLLGDVETLQVIKEYQRKFFLDVEDVLGMDVKQEACSERETEKKVFSSTISGKERKWIHDEVQGARKDIQKVRREIHKLAEDVQKLGRAILPQVLKKVEELLTFAKDTEVGKLPRLFVLTKDYGGFGRKLIPMVSGLQNVRLELLCEHRIEPHLVTAQRGITFATLEDGLLKQGLPYINLFLKLATLAAKVGAHVVAGLGDSIPDFSQVLALVIDTHELPSLPACLDFEGPGPSRTKPTVNFQESQLWLLDVLTKHHCCNSVRIHEVFGLKCVRYADSHVGWLCDEHSSRSDVSHLILS